MAAPDGEEPDVEGRVLALARAIDPQVEVIRIDPALADTAAFCEAYGFTLEESGNCILAKAKTGEARYAACLVQATRRLDLNGRSRLLVGARKASFAPAEDTPQLTDGMVPGGVTPIGLPSAIPVFVDTPIAALDRVVIGGGGRALKLRIATSALLALDAVTVADISR